MVKQVDRVGRKTRVLLIVILGLLVLLAVSMIGRYGRDNRSSGYEPPAPRLDSAVALRPLLVVEDGRIKPLGSYARNALLRYSGRERYAGLSAIDWLARVLFTPQEVDRDEVFLIDHPEVLEAIGVPSHGRGRYSFEELRTGAVELEQLANLTSGLPAEERSLVQRDLIRVWNNLVEFSELRAAFGFTYPDRDAFLVDTERAAELLQVPGIGPYSYLDLSLRRLLLEEHVSSAVTEHGQSGILPETDRTFLRLVRNLRLWDQAYSGLPLPIIPLIAVDGERWISPWQALAESQVATQVARELTALRDLQVAYVEAKQARFDLAASTFVRSQEQRLGSALSLPNPTLELFYRHVDPLGYTRWAYLIGISLAIVGMIVRKQWPERLSVSVLVLGFTIHTGAVLLRIIISGRPPVTNLYETFVFVSLLAAGAGLFLRYRGNQLGTLSGLVIGFALLWISGKFAAEGDTLRELQAVLDTNFWLSTHVVVITAGYCACVFAGFVGHIYLIQLVEHGAGAERLRRTYRLLFGALAFGLILSFIGTMLGGIWADQSWGRFWGWDPKENGALMIVLWCALLFHARLGKMIGEYGMAIGSVIGILVVMLAWFGINELGVGLHSYGFTEGVLSGLLIYAGIEAVFLAMIVLLIRWRAGHVADVPTSLDQ
uniref:ABC-type transport system involved in cytochrome c biogenesis, permease component n=1 Tax=uncultured Spirochaetales bacterium HF0500_06B09 TaxID=710994 RepID=E0XYA1_9SPIR|nr:ABC-type transport system involved in cytochrome c biogenesis, permease component [uncultured Spirochaetales bacterium HF0500_06B09]